MASADDIVDAIAVLIEEVRGLRADLADRPTRAPEIRNAGIVRALAESIDADGVLPFDAGEVFDHARFNHALAQALEASGAKTSLALGVIFRSLDGRDCGGVRVTRAGRQWVLEHT